MSQRRLFSPDIVKSDAFLDMPISTQALYFHLGMDADDDGFVNPKKVMRMIGTSDDDLKVLITKRFVLPFESGVVVIKHWLIHNSIRKDRYNETRYTEEKKTLYIKENKAYTEVATTRQPLGNQMAPQVKLSKVKLSKDKEETPSQQAKSFFAKESFYNELITDFSLNNDKNAITSEFDKFILYWTERNKSGTRQRWEQEPTFEVKRRIFTWLNRAGQFKQPNKETKIAFT
jgi:hypothetical protein